MLFTWLLPHFPRFPEADCALSGAHSQVGGLVHVLRSCAPLQRISCKTGNFSCCHNPHSVLQAEVFEALFSWTGTLVCVVCLALPLFLLAYLHPNVEYSGPLPGPARSASHHVSCPSQLPICAPSTSLDECVFFNFFVVRLPSSLTFWLFWLFFVFKLVVTLLVVQGSEVYLPMPPSWPEFSSIKTNRQENKIKHVSAP